MSKIYIYSTLTSDQVYANYKSGPNGVPTPTSTVLVRGGANLMTKALVTPQGAVTEITAEQLAELRKNEVFNLHEKNGFIVVSEAKTDIEKVVPDMVGRDQSAPIVEADEIIPAPASADADEPKPKRSRRG